MWVDEIRKISIIFTVLLYNKIYIYIYFIFVNLYNLCHIPLPGLTKLRKAPFASLCPTQSPPSYAKFGKPSLVPIMKGAETNPNSS